jgi:hypothetical protein
VVSQVHQIQHLIVLQMEQSWQVASQGDQNPDNIQKWKREFTGIGFCSHNFFVIRTKKISIINLSLATIFWGRGRERLISRGLVEWFKIRKDHLARNSSQTSSLAVDELTMVWTESQ